jgi:hypothetical protein
MASVHQKQPVPNVAVSILSVVEVLAVVITLGSFFVFDLLFFCAQELNPMKLTTEMNKTFNMVYIFSFTYAKVIGIDWITIYRNKSLTIGTINQNSYKLQQ